MLVVLPFPVVAEGGAAVRCAIGLLRGLHAHGVDVRALSADGRWDRTARPPADLSVELVEYDYPEPLRDRAHQLLAPHALLGAKPFVARVLAESAAADVVHVYGLEGGALVRRLDRPTVVQLDCITRRDRDLRPPWTHEGRIALELLRAERRACRRASWLLGSSPQVAHELARAAPRAHAVAAPLALDPRNYEPRASLTEPVAGLIGLAGWPPTANAVRRLLTRVWPRVVAQRPDARLRLAGIGMEPATFPDVPADLPGVEWLGRVPSATAFLSGLGLLLYPLGRGSGGKVKVLESLALGLPVVTTPDGAEGAGARSRATAPGAAVREAGLVVADDDAALAAAAAALLDDEAARRAAGEAAHATFTAHHAPLPATEPVVRLYERMLAASP